MDKENKQISYKKQIDELKKILKSEKFEKLKNRDKGIFDIQVEELANQYDECLKKLSGSNN